MPIPKRCRSCVHWLGHLSGDPNDIRCNRDYGHDARWGHFYDIKFREEGYGHPAYVTPDCQVLRWGLPIPELDENGYEIGPPPPPEWVDAYMPRRDAVGADYLELATPYGTFILHESEIKEAIELMAIDPKKLLKRFEERDEVRESVTKKNIKVHEKKLGGLGRVTTADYQPPYENGIERIPTGIVQLDYALGGGITPGTAIHFWGPRHVGKTTISLALEQAVLNYYRKHTYEFALESGASEERARAMADKEQILAIATEGYDSLYASRLGVKTNQVLRPRFEYGEQYLQYAIDLMKQDVLRLADLKEPGVFSYMQPCVLRLLKVDSLNNMKWYSDEHGARGKENVLHDNAKMGDRAQLLSQYQRLGNQMPSVPITQIYITQIRTKMGGTVAWDSGDVGNAFGHMVRLEIRMRDGKKPDEGDETKETILEFRQVQMPGGTNVRERGIVTLQQRLSGGFYIEDNIIHTAIEQGIINKSSWLTYIPRSGEDNKVTQQGTGIISYGEKLKEAGLMQEVYQRVLNVLSGRGMDEDGAVPVNPIVISGETSIEVDEEGLEQMQRQVSAELPSIG